VSDEDAPSSAGLEVYSHRKLPAPSLFIHRYRLSDMNDDPEVAASSDDDPDRESDSAGQTAEKSDSSGNPTAAPSQNP
jgi:hypothetical protein